jgi:hypothetical protein
MLEVFFFDNKNVGSCKLVNGFQLHQDFEMFASILATKEEKKTSILEVACRNREMKDFEMMPLAYLHQF